jgi:signal transduction histidine kinase
LDTCIRNAEYIKRVVKNTRELAELSTIDLYLTRENLSNILNEMLDKFDTIFKSCNIKIDNLVDRDIFVMTEKSRLLQVFKHITSNAVNSMIDKGGLLTYKTSKVEQKTGIFINVSVADTGIGLNRDQAEHLFDEFYKVDDSRHKLESTGLGLSICRCIIEKHGGHIWAKSFGPDKGVTINFTLPYVE